MNKLSRGSVNARLEDMPDESAIDYDNPQLDIMDDTAEDLLQLQECTVSD